MTRKTLFLTLALCLLACQSAWAQADIGLKHVGFTVGVVDAENVNTTFGVGVLADLGGFSPMVRVEPRLDYWSQSEEAFGASASVRDITLGTRVKYYFPVSNAKVRPFAGGGLGLHFLKAEVSVIDPFTGGTLKADDTSTKLGLDMGGGMLTPITPRASLLVELWYGIVSDFSQLSLRLGFVHAL